MTIIVAEIGSNWDNSRPFESLTAMVQAAAATGADFAKCQDWYPIENMPRPQAWKDQCRPWTLPPPVVPVLMREADLRGVRFLASVFTEDAVRRARRWGYPAVKIASSEIGNEALLRLVAELCPSCPIWLSTGEAGWDWGVIKQALEWLRPVRENVVLMHCVAQYPTPVEDVVLRRLAWMQEYVNLNVGWSSHVAAPAAAQVAAEAVRLGATVVEAHLRVKHVSPEGAPDYGNWSLFPDEFAELVEAARKAEDEDQGQ